MSGIPPTDPSQPPPSGPKGPAASSPKSSDWVLNSPWAKMFKGTGMSPTAKELHQMINSILKHQVQEIKKDQARMKKALRKIKEAIEGNG